MQHKSLLRKVKDTLTTNLCENEKTSKDKPGKKRKLHEELERIIPKPANLEEDDHFFRGGNKKNEDAPHKEEEN